MKQEELISMIDEIIFDYEVTGGIMPNTLDKAKLLIDYSPRKDKTPKVGNNEKAKEVCCPNCDNFNGFECRLVDVRCYNYKKFKQNG